VQFTLDWGKVFIVFIFDIYIYINKVVISVCLSVCLSDNNSGTAEPICLKFWLGKSGEQLKCS